MARRKGESPPPRFEQGAKVRVRYGARVPGFVDVPLGGWAGDVREVERAKGMTTYLIAWNRSTLQAMHSIYKKRCERDGFETDSMWLGEDDLELDDGVAVPIEQPTAIVTRPLSEKDQDDRVRMILGLTGDDPLPDVDTETLLAYHRYLKDHLKFPFRARHEFNGLSLTVHRLVDPEEHDLDEEFGLIVEARTRDGSFDVPLAELEDAVGNRRLVDDYGYWFHNS
jgi:hypothetical protein